MAELRYNPLLDDWTMVASHRQNRPDMPKNWCPFCPGSGKVPQQYDVLKYDNDFPALSQQPPEADEVGSEFYQTKQAYGKCEVILYSSEHTTTLPELSIQHIEKLIDLWIDRTTELSKDSKHKYIYIFENRGELVGVTMPHPHGQIYAYPYIPLKIRIELDNCRKYFRKNNECMICRINDEEIKFKERIIIENDDFITYLPFFTDYPYGVFIVSKRHISSIIQLDSSERRNLAKILKDTTGTLDSLFDYKFPYMMAIHQAPVNCEDVDNYYHFHIEFYPPMRSKDKVKYNASSETGAWAPCNTKAVEETSKELREAYRRFQKEGD